MTLASAEASDRKRFIETIQVGGEMSKGNHLLIHPIAGDRNSWPGGGGGKGKEEGGGMEEDRSARTEKGCSRPTTRRVLREERSTAVVRG